MRPVFGQVGSIQNLGWSSGRRQGGTVRLDVNVAWQGVPMIVPGK
jgi:hypothetical protein